MLAAAHATAGDVLLALAIPLNTALTLLVVVISTRTRRATKRVEEVVNGVEGGPPLAIVQPVEPVPGGSRSYDPPNLEDAP